MSHRIPLCPDCDAQLIPAGHIDYWCVSCQDNIPFTAAILVTTGGGND